jgi:hypothetical protein
MAGPHDVGGRPDAVGPVDRSEHVFADWETRVDAIQRLCGGARFWRLDEFRRTIESMSPEDYVSHSYYQRWVKAQAALLVEKGLLSADEIAERLERLRGEMGGAE